MTERDTGRDGTEWNGTDGTGWHGTARGTGTGPDAADGTDLQVFRCSRTGTGAQYGNLLTSSPFPVARRSALVIRIYGDQMQVYPPTDSLWP